MMKEVADGAAGSRLGRAGVVVITAIPANTPKTELQYHAGKLITIGEQATLFEKRLLEPLAAFMKNPPFFPRGCFEG